MPTADALAVGIQIILSAIDFTPAGLQSKVRTEVVVFAVDFLPSGDKFALKIPIAKAGAELPPSTMVYILVLIA